MMTRVVINHHSEAVTGVQEFEKWDCFVEDSRWILGGRTFNHKKNILLTDPNNGAYQSASVFCKVVAGVAHEPPTRAPSENYLGFRCSIGDRISDKTYLLVPLVSCEWWLYLEKVSCTVTGLESGTLVGSKMQHLYWTCTNIYIYI